MRPARVCASEALEQSPAGSGLHVTALEVTSSEPLWLVVWVFLTPSVIPLLVSDVCVPWDILPTTALTFMGHLLLVSPGLGVLPVVSILIPTVTPGVAV